VNFASPAFFLFLPLVLAAYHLLPGRSVKYAFLLGASWFFYAAWNPWFLWVLILPTVVDYYSGLLIERAATPGRKRFWLLASIVTNLGFLAAFKYTDFFLQNSLALARLFGHEVPAWSVKVVLPLGISFHTFQGISYTVDVYRGRIPAVRRFLDFALFVAFFPQLVAGPIVRAVDFLPQMGTPPRVTASHLVEGLHWFVLGMFKKVFLADRLAQFVDVVFTDPAAFDGATHRWAVLAYAGQIYCDFSGYSDLAIGCALWFGFRLPMNFDYPYLASSIADFWKRWHVSLSLWMRDYLYVPLGGNRHGDARTYFNLLTTLTLCGLWHGASWNYVLWGFYNGVLLALHRLFDRSLAGRSWADAVRRGWAYRVAGVAFTFLLVAVGLVMVRSVSWQGCWLVERSLVGLDSGGEYRVPAWVPLLVGLVAVGHLLGGLRGIRGRLLTWPPLVRAAVYVAAVVLIVAFGPGATKAFIYFQF
jgi:alginate O-acetyltransferase complex protein AlgI